MDNPIIVLQSDFTYKEGAVASMYGVIKSVSRDIEIISATHEIPHFDIWSASFRLSQYVRFWPKGTIFVSVVDPGVGTSRKASVAKTKDGYFIVSPDNGSFYHIMKTSGIENIYEIDVEKNRLKGYGTERISVFHGRDLFAYVAARIAAGELEYFEVGKEYSPFEIVGFKEREPYIKGNEVHGYIEIVDPNFGNLWTNIPITLLYEIGVSTSDTVDVEIRLRKERVFTKEAFFCNSFGFASKGTIVAYPNEMSKVALAVSSGNLLEEYGLGYGKEWKVRFKYGKR